MPVATRRLERDTIWAGAVWAGACGRVVVYARVPSHDQRHGLDRQVARPAAASGHAVGAVVTEAGSGLNGTRPKPCAPGCTAPARGAEPRGDRREERGGR